MFYTRKHFGLNRMWAPSTAQSCWNWIESKLSLNKEKPYWWESACLFLIEKYPFHIVWEDPHVLKILTGQVIWIQVGKTWDFVLKKKKKKGKVLAASKRKLHYHRNAWARNHWPELPDTLNEGGLSSAQSGAGYARSHSLLWLKTSLSASFPGVKIGWWLMRVSLLPSVELPKESA